MPTRHQTDVIIVLTLGLWVAVALAIGAVSGNHAPWYLNWYRWDAESYQAIWDHGYAAKAHLIAFPPLFPVLAGGLGTLTGLHFAVAGMLINIAALLGCGLLLARILEDSFQLPGTWAPLLLGSSPALYFALAPYSDLLFMYVFLHAAWLLSRPEHQLSRTEHLLLLALLFCAPLIRITGVIFAPLLLRGRWHALASCAGGMAWMAINYSVTGSALAFMEIQSAFGMAEGALVEGLRHSWGGLSVLPTTTNALYDWMQWHLLPISILAVFAVTALWLLATRRWLWLYLLTAVVLLSHNQAFWRSVVRYDLLVWPFLFAPWLSAWQRLSRPPWPHPGTAIPAAAVGVLLLAGAVTQYANAVRYVQGGWAF